MKGFSGSWGQLTGLWEVYGGNVFPSNCLKTVYLQRSIHKLGSGGQALSPNNLWNSVWTVETSGSKSLKHVTPKSGSFHVSLPSGGILLGYVSGVEKLIPVAWQEMDLRWKVFFIKTFIKCIPAYSLSCVWALQDLNAWLKRRKLLQLFYICRVATTHRCASPITCKGVDKYPRARFCWTGMEPGVRALSQPFQAVISQPVLPGVHALLLWG